MKYKRIVTKEEIDAVHKGEQGEIFENLEEAEIYLKNLINNRDYYINNNFFKKVGKRDLRWIIVAVILILAAFPFVEGIIFNELGMILSTLKIAALLSSPFVIFDRIECFIAKRQAIKEVDSEISALKVKCGFVDEDEAVFDDIKAVVKKEKTSKQEFDSFIANIRDDIYKIAQIKYIGYEQDLQTLYKLAEDYLEEKRKLGTTSDAYALAQNPKWFKELVVIEDRMKKASQVRQDQETNMQMLSQMKSTLYQEKINLTQIQSQEAKEEISESDIDPTGPTLTLGGK